MDAVHAEEVEIAVERAKALEALRSCRGMGVEGMVNSGFDFMVIERLDARQNNLAKLRASITHQDMKSALLETDRAILTQLSKELIKNCSNNKHKALIAAAAAAAAAAIKVTAPEIHGLKRVLLDVSLLIEEKKDNAIIICSICQEGFKAGDHDIREIMGCGHSYHYDCISKWIRKKLSCPMCRYQIPKQTHPHQQQQQQQ